MRRRPTFPFTFRDVDGLRELPPGEFPPAGAMVWKENELGLLLPAHLASSPLSGSNEDEDVTAARPAMRFVAATLSWKEVSGQKGTLAEIADRLRQYSLAQVLWMVSRISLALDADTEKRGSRFPAIGRVGNDIVGHFQIARRLLGPEGARNLFRKFRAVAGPRVDPRRHAIFHERQLLNAMKLACLVVEPDAPESERSTEPFVEALLMLNDVLDDAIENADHKSEAGRQAMELYLAANMLFNQSNHPLHDFVRAHYLYVENHKELVGKGIVEMPVLLEQATGLDATTTWNALFALTVGFLRDMPDVDAGKIATNRQQYLAGLTALPEKERDQWFALGSRSLHKLQQAVRENFTLEDPAFFDVLEFEKTPLIEVGDAVFCVSMPLLWRLATASIWHRILDEKVFPDKNFRRDILKTRGMIVERYATDILSRTFGEPRFVPERELKRFATKQHQKVCDAVIVYSDAVILFESKAVTPLLDTRHGLDYENYRRKWNETVTAAASQIESTLRLIREGLFEPLGISASIGPDVFPVVSTFELPLNYMTYEVIRDVDLANHPLSQHMASGEVRHIQFLEIEDLELWEVAAERGRSIVELLRRKTSDPRLAEISFTQFLDLSGETFQHGHSSWHVDRYKALTRETREYLRSRGLPFEEDPVAQPAK